MLMWDEIYSDDEYVYGKTPNDFLEQNVEILKPGKVLCIADGEGRNSVYLAKQGFDVTSVDSSRVGLEKAARLADAEGVSVDFLHCDLADFNFNAAEWDSIVSIFCHLPPQLRRKTHAGVVQGLVKDGIFLLEAYTPEQIHYGTGGPPTTELMVSLEMLGQELDELETIHQQEIARDVVEGSKHNGTASVVQLIARR
jgi:SAM-dependent methyltransferase